MTHADIFNQINAAVSAFNAEIKQTESDYQTRRQAASDTLDQILKNAQTDCAGIGHLMGVATKSKDDPTGLKPTCVICGYKDLDATSPLRDLVNKGIE